MQRKQGGLVPVAETLADLHGPVTATRDASLNSHSLPLSGLFASGWTSIPRAPESSGSVNPYFHRVV